MDLQEAFNGNMQAGISSTRENLAQRSETKRKIQF